MAQLAHIATPQSSIWSWMTTVDHKRIGLMYGATALFFFLVGGVEALLIRTQLARPNGQVLDADLYNQLFTTHALTMIFLAIMPLTVALMNYFIPLHIGARDVAFPRLNALSYWIYLTGGIMLSASFFLGGAPDGGWFNYAPLSATEYSPSASIDYYVVSLLILGTSSLVGAMNFTVTIVNMRAPGMTMMRLPVFTWSSLVVSFLLLLSLPVLTVALVQLYFDRNFGTSFFLPERGGDPILWQHVFWIFGHPEVYILILPSMGVISEVLPVMSRKPIFGYAAILFSTIAIAVLGFGVWSHHMFTTGLGTVPQIVFSASTMTIGIPTGIKIFNWLGTMYGGNIRFTTATYYAVSFLVLFTIGGISGVMHASPGIDSQQQDSYFIVAHIHYVLFGGSMMGLFAGFYYWFPKISGRFLSERMGQVSFWFMFAGMNLTFFPMHFLGLSGMPRRIYTYESGLGWDSWNLVATVGSYVLAVGVLVFVINVVRTLRSAPRAPRDPWGGATLEWTTDSPPPAHNFDTIPVVRDRDPVWFERDHVSLVSEPATTERSRGTIHLPPPSYFPLVVAFGIASIGVGLLSHLGMAVAGVVVLVYGVWGWALEPTD